MRSIILSCFILLSSTPSSAADLSVVRGELESGRLYVPCGFDGFSESCLVDTGATFSSVANLEFFKSYSITGKIRFKSASGISKEADEINIRSLQIDSSQMENVKVARLNPQEGFASVVGINALNNRPFSFLFNSGATLTLGAQMPLNLSAGIDIYEKGIFSVPANLGDSHAKGLWDTGAGLTSVDVEYVASHPGDFTFVMDIPNGTDATGNPVVMKLYKAKTIEIGKHAFQNVNVLAINFDVIREHIAKDIVMIIGFNLITNANWYFDLQHKTWMVE